MVHWRDHRIFDNEMEVGVVSQLCWSSSYCQVFLAGIDSQGIVVDGGLLLPVVRMLEDDDDPSRMMLTSASFFHSSLTSKDALFHCSPIIFEISGFVKVGFFATMPA